MAVAVMTVVFSAVVFGVRLGEVVVARHHVEAAADLAAVGAAGYVVDGVGVACAKAARVTGRMGVELAECEVVGWEVRVLVVGASSVFGAPSARARAGPAEGG